MLPPVVNKKGFKLSINRYEHILEFTNRQIEIYMHAYFNSDQNSNYWFKNAQCGFKREQNSAPLNHTVSKKQHEAYVILKFEAF